jgi:hypothetical protein
LMTLKFLFFGTLILSNSLNSPLLSFSDWGIC